MRDPLSLILVHLRRFGFVPLGRLVCIRMLVEWYRGEYSGSSPSVEDRLKNDPILAMRGLGKEIWADVDPDEYVRQLREGWE